MDTLAYLASMRAYLIEHDRALPAAYTRHLDKTRSDFAVRALACCAAAGIAWC